MSLPPNSRLGAFDIVSPLGAGGMGEVYRARDTRLGREVAIKTLPADFAADPERLARFRREAQALAALNHPNIAAIYGLEESGGSPYLVLELIEGETLAARLTHGALAVRDALQLGIQIAAGVEAAHERGIVHRDLKPGNVMITSSGLVKVLDFGLAKHDVTPDGATTGPSERAASDSPTLTAHGATLFGAIIGTAAYMSPEQARGKPVDRRSDVWSFGCLLFECLAGRPAFTGETASDLIARILEREPDWSALPSGAPPRLREVLRRCLRRDASERPRDIRDVRLELSEIAAGDRMNAGSLDNYIAVLPFENMSGTDDEYFADGVTDEILNVLAQVKGLRVAARTSCFAFKGRREDLRVIGEKLGVSTVLEGSVRRSGPRLRITAQLVNVADGYQLWSERYDREMTDVFAVQDEIANAIASRLRGASHVDSRGERRGTTNLEAYELFLKGRALLNQRGRFILEAIPCFERAIELDSQYAEAMAWMADGWRLTGTMGINASDVMPRARTMAERALAIAPGLPEALATIATVEAQYERDYPRAAEWWAKALAADPRHTRSRCERALWSIGLAALTPEQGVLETRLATEDDPMNAWAAAIHSFVLSVAKRHAEAVAEGERAVGIDPESFIAKWMLLQARTGADDTERALASIPEMLATSGRYVWALGTLAYLRARIGRRDAARAVYDELEARSRFEYVGPFWLAATASAAGLVDEAMRYARRAADERDPLVVLSRHMPQWDEVRLDPRFAEIERAVWG